MHFEILKKNKYFFWVICICICAVIYKCQFLPLPYYWDEAWPYSVGVHTLYDNGLSLIPGAIPTFIARGHPLMFHFLAALWMKLFGTGLLSGHSFALLISILLLFTIYWFCNVFFSARVGFTAALLFASQGIFIAQSVFLMPEMLMALWTMLCFFTYFKEKYVFFVLCATAMLLTKESGGVFFVATLLCEFLLLLSAKEKEYKLFFKKAGVISLPVLIASTNYIIQKIKFGWFLYPFYMNYISSAWKAFTDTLPNAAAYTFIYDGRNGFSFFIIAAVITLFVSQKKIVILQERKIIFFFSIFIPLYLIFSSINYYIPRYLLCVFPPFFIIGSVLIDRVFSRIKVIYPLIVAGLSITGLFFYSRPKANGDMDYSPSIKTDKAVVDYCEKQDLFDKYIFTTGVLRYDFNERYAGYTSGKEFTHIQWQFTAQTEYCIFSKDEYDGNLFDKIKRENHLVLIQRFEQKYAWCELYKVVKSN